MKKQFSCVTPDSKFIYGIHKPRYSVANVRGEKKLSSLGLFEDGSDFFNENNFPATDVLVEEATWIYEIPNPFPFRGATFIDKNWADSSAEDSSRISLPQQQELSFNTFLQQHKLSMDLLKALPRPMLLTLATCSTDPQDLAAIADLCCAFVRDDEGSVAGMQYLKTADGRAYAKISDHDLFEAVANNPHLPDKYKIAMVIRPGAQGSSEIVGEWPASKGSHVFEYLRRNSYISGGHYAANMADDAIRYSMSALTQDDMKGLRHLYYQRMYLRFAEILGISQLKGSLYSDVELEALRLQILEEIDADGGENLATLWGWNFGFDYSPTDYRLHASHQQIHQQYAVIPESVQTYSSLEQQHGTMTPFSSGDMIAGVIEDYSRIHKSDFFTDYCNAIANNSRMDGRSDLPDSLVVWEDEAVMLFVPKAQTSQWELQIMTKPDSHGQFTGNILEADMQCRDSLNNAILHAQQILEKLGARMVTSIEFSKRIMERSDFNQPLLYSLLPKLPFSMGAFSEAQLRFINGHYPEDFAAACRKQL